MITPDGTLRAISIFSLMKFFPGSDPNVIAGFMELLGDMCETDAQVLWLAKRTVQLHNEWPGVQEVRAVLCSKFSPRDGIECYSGVYPSGIPAERESSRLMLVESTIPANPRLVAASDDPDLELLARETAEALKMPLMPKYRARTPAEIRTEDKLRELFKLEGEVKS